MHPCLHTCMNTEWDAGNQASCFVLIPWENQAAKKPCRCMVFTHRWDEGIILNVGLLIHKPQTPVELSSNIITYIFSIRYALCASVMRSCPQVSEFAFWVREHKYQSHSAMLWFPDGKTTISSEKLHLNSDFHVFMESQSVMCCDQTAHQITFAKSLPSDFPVLKILIILLFDRWCGQVVHI